MTRQTAGTTEPFLKSVAEAFTQRFSAAELEQIIFVTPTKRSVTFLDKYLAEARKKPAIGPEVLTLGRFTARVAGRVEASETESLFILHSAHRRLQQGTAVSFDRFRFWGRTILNDFNDIDGSLADAKQLLRSVRNLRNLSTNYLTPEQLEVIRHYWPNSLEHHPAVMEQSVAGESPRMWTGIDDSRGYASEKFSKLWEMLWPLYEAFNKEMDERGLASAGRAQRLALKELEEAEELPFSRIVFVGMANLSVAQLRVMELLKKRGVADFYWDSAPCLAALDPDGEGSDVVARYAREFPSELAITPPPPPAPDITILGSPTHIGQCRVVAKELQEWIDTGVIANPDNAVNTAIIVPEADMLMPLTGVLPADFGKVNITMGVPMRQTPLAALFRSLFTARRHASKWRGVIHFLAADIEGLAGQPLLLSMAPEVAEGLCTLLASNRSRMISAEACREVAGEYALLFEAPGRGADGAGEASEWLLRAIELLTAHINRNARDATLTRLLLENYRNEVGQLLRTIDDYGIEMADVTFLQIVERIVNSARVSFEGEPLAGLQVMSMLETRALDFDNIVIMSMNDRIVPGSRRPATFIPSSIRAAFGLPLPRSAEAMDAYYFYRLFTRAKHITLVYDSRSLGTRTSEMSRYLVQLMLLSSVTGLPRPRHARYAFGPTVIDRPGFSVDKRSPHIAERLARYRADYQPPDGADPADRRYRKRFISASALNTYIECPLHFYLQYVEDMNTDMVETDFIDSASYGSIVHDVMEQVYDDLSGGRQGAVITADMLERYASPANEIKIDKLVIRAVNDKYLHRPPERFEEPLKGEATLLAVLIRRMVRHLLMDEAKTFAPITYLQCEKNEVTTLQVAPGLEVNMKMLIDRVDEVGGVRRIVDYKTGGDPTKFNTLDDLFKVGKDRSKAILQLLLYARLYRNLHNFDSSRPLQPFIYKLKELMKGDALKPLQFGKASFDSDLMVASEINAMIDAKIAEIFDPDVPFAQGESEHACTFCSFTDICARVKQS